MQRVWLDTEFITNNLTLNGLVSIALTSDAGLEYYAVNRYTDTLMDGLKPTSQQWMRDNVWPHIPGGHPDTFDIDHPDVKPYFTIRNEIGEFFRKLCHSGWADEDILLFVNRGAQDVIRLHTLWDNDWDPDVMPPWIPTFARDIADVKRSSPLARKALPKQDESTLHHPLHDARHERKTIMFLEKYIEAAKK